MSTPTSDSAAIRQIIRALKGSGHTLRFVYDGEEDLDVSTETQALSAITAVDDAFLHVFLPDGETTGYVRFVMGNDPDEVAADWTVNLSPVIDDLTESWWS